MKKQSVSVVETNLVGCFMKKSLWISVVCALTLFANSALAVTINSSNAAGGDSALNSMTDPSKNVLWNIAQSLTTGQVITGASLTISALYNAQRLATDKLYISLVTTSSGK